MRTLLLLPLLLVASCARPVSQVQPPNQITAADENPIVAALTHFRSLPDLWLPKSSLSQGVLLVDGHYETSEGFISAAQLRGDVSKEHWSVPEDARLDMERRADAKEAFPTAQLPSFIHVIDFEAQPPGDTLEFTERQFDFFSARLRTERAPFICWSGATVYGTSFAIASPTTSDTCGAALQAKEQRFESFYLE